MINRRIPFGATVGLIVMFLLSSLIYLFGIHDTTTGSDGAQTTASHLPFLMILTEGNRTCFALSTFDAFIGITCQSD